MKLMNFDEFSSQEESLTESVFIKNPGEGILNPSTREFLDAYHNKSGVRQNRVQRQQNQMADRAMARQKSITTVFGNEAERAADWKTIQNYNKRVQ